MLDIDVYGGIGDEFDEGGVTAVSFVRALRDADGEDVTIHINSSGGSVFDANTMAEALRGYKGHTTASIEGLAASAASYFALTADDVVINPSALMMIHNPWDFAVGDAEDMRKKADMLDKARSTISAQYARKTGRTVDEIEELMDAETWFTAQEAVEFGLVDRMSDSEPIAACVRCEDMKRFRNAPEGLLTSDEKADEKAKNPSDEEDEKADEKPVGDEGATIDGADDGKAVTGSVEVAAGAAARTVCVNGQFLKY